MTTVLDRIRAYKLEEIAARKTARPYVEVEAAAKAAPPLRDFTAALRAALADRRYGLIAEIKKASPSKGLIRDDFNPPELARAYEAGGATCLSVLTDAPSFQGADAHLSAARTAASLPVIRKDFVYDPYQIAEARALGADCILIIMASVENAQAAELEAAAHDWGMDALIEVHDEAEMERAFDLKSRLLGVNNRDLKTFKIDISTTERLAALAPADRLLIGESGLAAPADLARLSHSGARCFLIGESLMRQSDVSATTRTLLANPWFPGEAAA